MMDRLCTGNLKSDMKGSTVVANPRLERLVSHQMRCFNGHRVVVHQTHVNDVSNVHNLPVVVHMDATVDSEPARDF